jgi:Kef-type K+ transport system membrane component KefB
MLPQLSLTEPLARLLLQILLILLASRLLGALARRLGQPFVIGEMAAGIALGPSLLGAVAPAVSGSLFAPESLGFLGVLSQIGVIVFLFGTGLEFAWSHLRDRAPTAFVISGVSIVLPFGLGVLAARVLYDSAATPTIPFHAFALFIGIAMSITAFPVLARILAERRMTSTPVGTLALTCAAVDDVTAWTLLAFVVAVVTSGGALTTVLTTMGLTGLFVLVMGKVVRPALRAWFRRSPGGEAFNEQMASAIVLLFAAALATELIGVHALFGAFVAGVTFPASEEVRADIRTRVETFSSVVLLPLFFAHTGLRTSIGLMSDWSVAATCLAIIALATIGKLGGSLLAGRVMGLDWNTSFVLGALMNTRGLMELIALNVGYDLGVISPQLFTIFVVMALTTTAMTGPLVDAALRKTPLAVG